MEADDSLFDGRALKLADWPIQDQTMWRNACLPDEDLLVDQVAADWRPSSKELFERCYGMWLNWLLSQDLLDGDLAPGARVSRERLVQYLGARRRLGNGARTLVNHAVSLRHMFEALAPDQDWTWMLSAICRLKTKVVRTTNHSDLPSIRELFELGLALMERAEFGSGKSPKQRAILYRNGLAIAMLASRPMMRRTNMASMRIGHHIDRDGPVFRLKFSGEEMKGKRALGTQLPAILTACIECYLAEHRPRLLGPKEDKNGAFWISALGNPIYPKAMSNEIGDVTEQAFGRRVTMHRFRHAAGSSIAKEDPSHVGIVTTMLGHADFRTSERYYIFADEHAAFSRANDVIDALERSTEEALERSAERESQD